MPKQKAPKSEQLTDKLNAFISQAQTLSAVAATAPAHAALLKSLAGIATDIARLVSGVDTPHAKRLASEWRAVVLGASLGMREAITGSASLVLLTTAFLATNKEVLDA
jgi:hypothetical protein